jgi:peroxiredoxin
MVGKRAPDFTLADLQGNTVSLSEFKGKVVMLDFWATWCPPCVQEIPHFIELYEEYREQGLAMIGISLDRQGVGVVKAFSQRYGINYPILMADGSISAKYGGIRGIPTTFVIDREGTIKRMYVGYRDKSVFENDIKTFLPAGSSGQQEAETGAGKYVKKLNRIATAGRSQDGNAAPHYSKAIDLYVEKPEGLTRRLMRNPEGLTKQQKAMLKQWLQGNSTALEQVALGSSKPYCWFKLKGPKVDVNPHLEEIRELVFALEARALLKAENGDTNSAIDDIITLYRFGAHVSDGPKPLVEKMIGIAAESISVRAAFHILDRNLLDGTSMETLEDKFRLLAADADEKYDMRGEKIVMQQQVENELAGAFYKKHLDGTLEYLEAVAEMTPWQLYNERDALKDKTNPWVETLSPVIIRTIENEYRSRAAAKALVTTLAVLRYNNEKNGYPENLSQLVSAGYLKEPPNDPFSDKSLVYKRTQEGFMLYSYGADYDDDGGQYSRWGYDPQGGDQVFWPVKKQ